MWLKYGKQKLVQEAEPNLAISLSVPESAAKCFKLLSFVFSSLSHYQ